ncbi:MAG: 4Fe-4S dicluster domain-containing protein [Candidatus Sumerlaeota bacterium]|nr:4Fe-4S dicluster domain-containing protein [Candidatus Sumerlaeota bacterium]
MIQRAIQKLAREKLEAKAIDLFLGYARGTLPGRVKPFAAAGAADCDRLVWNENCDTNLVNYLARYPGKKIGIVVKPCDARTLVTLLHENQVKRENLFIVGVNCPGVKTGVGAEAAMQPQCLACEIRKPPIADVTLGGPVETAIAPQAKLAGELWDEFKGEMQRCIRCFACRNACPLCYCTTCFAEQTMPELVYPGNDAAESAFFQLGRIMHIAGRCGECGGCERACPMDIPLQKIIRKAAAFLEETYGEKAGLSVETPGALGTFSPTDNNSIFL